MSAKLLKDRRWRLNNLYWIKDKNGKRVKFRFKPEQAKYFDNQHSRNVILKARQLGFTTLECIIQLDAALFESASCALIAHKLDDAKRLFREKTKYAYDNLPEAIRNGNPASNDRAGELVFANGGSVAVSTSFRGGTLKRLHVSEFGKICAQYPDKAREIKSGAFEAVSLNGVITLESTAEGREGLFYEYCKEAEKNMLSGNKLGVLDWKFFFFAWWGNSEYQIQETEISERLEKYFVKLEAERGIKLTGGQKSWYQAKDKDQGDDVKREYPSTPEEAFEQSVEGAYYSKQFTQIYKDGRITDLPDNSHLPVYTYWDLGVGDSTAIWFVRKVGEERHIIDFYESSGEGLRHYLKIIKDKGYQYAKHYAPHDIENREFAGDAKSRKQLAQEGYEIDGRVYSLRFEVVPKESIDNGIELVREKLAVCVFDSRKCEEGIKALESYRKAWDDKNGCWRNTPLHDWTSHAADAFRYFAVSDTKRKRISKQTGLRL